MKKIKDMDIDVNGFGELAGMFRDSGFQASMLGEAVEIIKDMKDAGAVVFFAFTANMVASGLRGLIKELCRKGFVDVVVTTAGSVDHDVIKSFDGYEMGSFDTDDAELHKKGINRLGNILIPNDRFVLFEKKVQEIFREIYRKRKAVSPSGLIDFIGSKLNESSFLYWCHKKGIPVFCPGITDGAIGLQMYFFKQENGDFSVDVTGDMKRLADVVLSAERTGGIILGGGISKHHVIGANIVRGGLDYAVYVTTASEYDGSLSGARTREAKSWGKITEKGREVTVVGDATIVFPLIALALRDRGVL